MNTVLAKFEVYGFKKPVSSSVDRHKNPLQIHEDC